MTFQKQILRITSALTVSISYGHLLHIFSQVSEDPSFTDLSVAGFHRRPMHMEPPTEYADVYRQRGRTQVLPLPVSDALDKHSLASQELALIGNVQPNTIVSKYINV